MRPELEPALTAFVPLAGAAIVQWLVLRPQVTGVGRWAVAYRVTFLVGWIVIGFLIGGGAGLAAGSLYPLVDNVVRYALRQLPSGIVGGAVFGATSGACLIWLLRQLIYAVLKRDGFYYCEFHNRLNPDLISPDLANFG